MKNISNALKTFLLTNRNAIRADLFTVTLARKGTVLRNTTYDSDISFGGNLFRQAQPRFTRGQIKTTAGLVTDTMELSMQDDGSTLVDGSTPLAYALKGGFDGALVRVETVYGPPSGIDLTMGSEIKFIGNIAEPTEIGRNLAKFKVASLVQLLDTLVPTLMIQPACNHQLYDAGCGLVKASFGVNKIVAGGTTQAKVLATVAYSQADGWFDQGTILFTSGLNSGFEYSVRTFAANVLQLAVPAIYTINAGDTFTVFAGCARTQAVCASAKFNNLGNFLAMPYVPVPETVL